MQIHFSNAENQLRWAWTDGLQTLGQQEIAVRVSWAEHDPQDRLLIDLLKFLEGYLINQPRRILPDQALRNGWTMLRFVSNRHTVKVMILARQWHQFHIRIDLP